MHAMRSIPVLLFAAGFAAAQVVTTIRLESPAEREGWRHLVRKLDGTTISIAWEVLPLKDCLRQIARSVGANVVLGAALKDREDEPITLELDRVRVLTLLKVLGESHGISFQHRH